MRDDDDDDIQAAAQTGIAFAVLVAVGIGFVTCGPVRAQHDDALVLAQLVTHESGWDHPSDAAAIVAVLRNSGGRVGMTPQAFARVYAPRFAGHTVARQWVYRLTADGADPHAGIRWALYRERWLAILAATRAALEADTVVCAATDWGNARDFARRRAQGRQFRMVDCGNTQGLYAVRGAR